MNSDAGSFDLYYKDEKINGQRHSIGSETIFRIIFSNSRAPLVITWAGQENKYRFWTSIPEGRQREAEEIGKLIEQYYKKN
jgi:hypothetical protein